MQILSFSSRRTPKILPVWPFFLVLYMKDVVSRLPVRVPRKLPCPEKFLVTRLYYNPAYLRIVLRKNQFINSLVVYFKKFMKMLLNASIFSLIILNLVERVFRTVTTATDTCMKEVIDSFLRNFPLKENYGKAKSINFIYHCPKFSQQRSFSFLYCHIYRTLYDISNL